MGNISREDFEYLSKFSTLEDLLEHKYAKIKEYRIDRGNFEHEIRILHSKTAISNIELQRCEDLERKIERCNVMIEEFTHIDQVFIHYFRDRCGTV